MIQDDSTRRAALLFGVVLLISAVPSPVDAFTFQPVFSDDVVASVNVDGVVHVARAVHANVLANATGETPDLGPLGALIDSLGNATPGCDTLEFQDCEPKGDALTDLLGKGYVSASRPALSGFDDAREFGP